MFGRTKKAITTTVMAALITASAVAALPAFAQKAQITTLRDPLVLGAPNAAKLQAAQPGQPEIPGDGPIPNPVTGGDGGAPALPPSGVADPTSGNIFPSRVGPGTQVPWWFNSAGRHVTQNGQQDATMNNGGDLPGASFWGPGAQSNGTATVNNGGDLGNAQGLVNNGGDRNGAQNMVNNGGDRNGAQNMVNNGGDRNGAQNMVNNGGDRNGAQNMVNNGGDRNGAQNMVNNGGDRNGAQNMVNNGGDLGNAQGLINDGGDKKGAQFMIPPLFVHPIQPNNYNFQGPLPTVRIFCRYLVILGLVAATVWMAFACTAMVFGSKYGASRAIGTAGGLMLLLMGYTIWKVVQMDTFNGNTTAWWAMYRNGAPMNIVPYRGQQAQKN